MPSLTGAVRKQAWKDSFLRDVEMLGTWNLELGKRIRISSDAVWPFAVDERIVICALVRSDEKRICQSDNAP